MRIYDLTVSVKVHPRLSGLTLLDVDVKTSTGDFHTSEVIPEDDLISNWDYLWKLTGKLLEEGMKQDGKI